jgi:glycosyltransferase involved in cell wall biosynthesis
MRIAHLSDVCRPHVGGIEIFVDDLAARQAAAGHDVAILTGSAGSADVARLGVSVIRPRHRMSALAHVADVRRRLADREFDVVHAHLSVVSPYSTMMAGHAARAGLPVVLTVHSMWNGRKTLVRTVGGLVGWDAWPAVWTSVSAAASADVEEALSGRRVAVVPNAVDSQWWGSVATRLGSRARDKRPITFVSVMRMVERKRPLALVRCLQRARQVTPADIPMRAVLVGDGPLASIVDDELRRRHMAGWVSMTGEIPRERVRDVYADADVYVAPATRESFGIAALEARAVGLAVVAMRSGGVGDFIADGVEGVLCVDDADLADAIATMAARPGIVDAMREHNRAVAPRVSWDDTLASFARCYERAARLCDAARVEPGGARYAGSRLVR